MAECRRARLDAGAFFDVRGEQFADAAEPRPAEGVEPALGVGVIHGVEREPFGDDDQRRAAAIVRGGHPFADLVDRGLLFRDQNHVCTGRHPGVQCNPADVPTHDFSHHAAVVRVAGGAQAIHRIGRDLHGRVETERVVGGIEVVVDGLRDADDLDPGIRQSFRRRERSLATDCDDRVDAVLGHDLVDAVDAADALKRVGS